MKSRTVGLQRGSTTLLFVLLVVLSVVGVRMIAELSGVMAARANAQAAADAVALAGAHSGRSEARQIAALNSATIVEYVEQGSTVLVTVVVGGASARARAEAIETWPWEESQRGGIGDSGP